MPLLYGIGNVVLPSVASFTNRGQAVTHFCDVARFTTMLAICLSGVLVVVTPSAIRFLFGRAFEPAISCALILVPAAAVLGINFVLEEGIRGLGSPYSVLLAELVGLMVTAASLASMLPSMGILGAALASFFGYSAVTITLLFTAYRIVGLSPSFLLPRRCDIELGINRFRLIARGFAALSW
jgi:O-antigen/teichoic acid export membrane protein